MVTALTYGSAQSSQTTVTAVKHWDIFENENSSTKIILGHILRDLIEIYQTPSYFQEDLSESSSFVSRIFYLDLSGLLECVLGI